MSWWAWPVVAVALLGPMAVARLFRPAACPKCGSSKVRLLYAKRQSVIGWVVFLAGLLAPGWWHLLAVAGVLAIVFAPAGTTRALCLACRHAWLVVPGARRASAGNGHPLPGKLRGAFLESFDAARARARGH